MKDDDIIKYCNCMEEIKRRISAIDSVLASRNTTIYHATNVEFVCLQIRKILELIALASLVANKEEYALQHQKFAKHWRAKDILDKIEAINPRFYPVPREQIIDSVSGKVIEVVPIKETFLTRAEFPDVYNACSEAIHAVNPFGTSIDYAALERNIPIWRNKIKYLLSHHLIQLFNEKQMLWAIMQDKNDGRVHAGIFERIDK